MTRVYRSFLYSLTVIMSFATAIFTAQAGVVLSRGDHGLQVSEAAFLIVNGKDKVLVLGPEAKVVGPIGKLQAVKLGESVLKDSKGAFAIYAEHNFQYILPEALPKNSQVTPTTAWVSARLGLKKSASDKNPEEIPASSFVAFLPGGVEELGHLCSDTKVLGFFAEPGKAFATRVELMQAAVKRYGNDPALAFLQRDLEFAIRSRYEQFENGLGNSAVLDEALKLVELSQAVYPNQPEQEAIRRKVTGRKQWLDQKIAIFHALVAVNEWDTLLLSTRPFEIYEQAFPDIAAMRLSALRSSQAAHSQSGDELLKEREYELALQEFRLATRRQPSDKLSQQKAMIAWANYSREVALENKRKRKQLGPGERDILNQGIQFATNYKSENKLDLALKSILEAERIDPDSLQMLLKKAEILGAQREFSAALAVLDRYDLYALDDEREPASSQRNEILFRRTSMLEDTRSQLQKAWATGAYHTIYNLSLRGLQAKDDDAEFLYNAGVAAQITRETQRGREYLARYLDLSNTLDANVKQRAEVRRMMASPQEAIQTEEGDPNWLSGKKLPKNVFYCPISLAFQARIERIEASNKMKVNFEWENDRLSSINPIFEKPDHATNEKRISFAYDERVPQVNVALEGETRAPKLVGSDPDELVRRSSLVVLNNPYINPDAVQKLTGKNVSLGIAGNRFFQPFVWEKLHYFQFTYDSAGRVAQARELTGPNGALTDFVLQFDWNGQQLTSIRGYQGVDDRHRSKVYERTMEYQEGRLILEEIQWQGKSSKVNYIYNGGRLVSANCAVDGSLDDRSRHVFFR